MCELSFVYAVAAPLQSTCLSHRLGYCLIPCRWLAETHFPDSLASSLHLRPTGVPQVEHWKEQAGLSPEKRQMVDLTDVADERWKNPDLDQQSVYSPKPN